MAAPPNSSCYSPAGPGVGRPCVVSDSLVDDRGCLTDGTERQAFPRDVNLESRRPLNSTLDQRLGERVFYILLQSPAERTCPITAVRARFLEYPLPCFRRYNYLHLPVNQRVVQLAHQQIDDAKQIFVAERIKNNHFVQPVQKLRVERPLYFVHHHIFHALLPGFIRAGLEAHRRALLQMTRAEIGRHDDDGVPEIHGIAEPVGQLTVFKHLQQYIEDVRMRFLDFIQQDDRVRRPADAFRQLTAFFVAHVPRRRADQLRDGVLLHELRHIEADQRLLRTKQKLRQAASNFGFADAGRPEEKEAAHRTQRRLESRAAAANSAGQRGDGFVLANDALVEFRLNAQKLDRKST